ncbi:hypothetical protein GCM10023065_22270 [Microbacterium laevaniformans]|nr:hypothetical protein GCM10017578_21900 [Microbacterium laevaniformans]
MVAAGVAGLIIGCLATLGVTGAVTSADKAAAEAEAAASASAAAAARDNRLAVSPSKPTIWDKIRDMIRKAPRDGWVALGVFALFLLGPIFALYGMQSSGSPLREQVAVWAIVFLAEGMVGAILRLLSHDGPRWLDRVGKALGAAAAVGAFWGFFIAQVASIARS